MQYKEYPPDFSEKLEAAQKLDEYWKGITNEPWANCFGFVLFLFFPEILVQYEQVTQEHARQYYSPLVFAEEVASFPSVEESEDQDTYSIFLASQSHFLSIQNTRGGSHNYWHTAVISPDNPEHIIHRPRVNMPIEGPLHYKEALKAYLPRRRWKRFLYLREESPYIWKFWRITS